MTVAVPAAPRTAKLAGTLLAVILLPGCGLVGGPRVPAETDGLTVTSPAFRDGGRIPERYTCAGTETSPPLSWEGAPHNAAALSLVVDDPDAPGGTFVHWVVFNIEPDVTSVPEGMVPAGGEQAQNSGGEVGYVGPCPQRGEHRYRFTVYALRQEMPLSEGAALKDALAQISKRSVASGRLVGRNGEK